MGMFDTFIKGDIEIQLKNGPCCMDVYYEGDELPEEFPVNAVIHGHEGCVVIRNQQVAEIRGDKDRILVDGGDAGYDDLPHLDKWGSTYTKPQDLTGNNPLVQAMDEVEAKLVLRGPPLTDADIEAAIIEGACEGNI